MKRAQNAGAATPALRRPFKIPALKPPCSATQPPQQAIAAPTPPPSRSLAPAAAASSSEEAGEPSGLRLCAPLAATPATAEVIAASAPPRPKLTKLPDLRKKLVAAAGGAEAQPQSNVPPAVGWAGLGRDEHAAAAVCVAKVPAGQPPPVAVSAAALVTAAAEAPSASAAPPPPKPPAPTPAAVPSAPTAAAAAPAPGGKAAGWVVKRLPVESPESLPQQPQPARMPPAAQLLGHLPALPVASAAMLPLDHPAFGDLTAVAARVEAALVPQAVEATVGSASSGLSAASGLRLLAAALSQHPVPGGGRALGQNHLLRVLHQPPQKIAATQPAGGAAPATTAAAAALRPLAGPGTAAAEGGQPASLGASAAMPLPPAEQRPAGVAPAALPAPTPPAVDEASLRRALVEDCSVPLSYLRSLLRG